VKCMEKNSTQSTACFAAIRVGWPSPDDLPG
jgi:hypothetical protein